VQPARARAAGEQRAFGFVDSAVVRLLGQLTFQSESLEGIGEGEHRPRSLLFAEDSEASFEEPGFNIEPHGFAANEPAEFDGGRVVEPGPARQDVFRHRDREDGDARE
jgi:hypothetical protein